MHNFVAAAENGPLVVRPLNANDGSGADQMVTVDAGSLVRISYFNSCWTGISCPFTYRLSIIFETKPQLIVS